MTPIGNIPSDIRAEALMEYIESFSKCRVSLKSQHNRNAHRDVATVSQKSDALVLDIARDSIYNTLPEYLFHSIDRFSHIPAYEKKERRDEEFAMQEREKEEAFRFFAPLDLLLLRQRMNIVKQTRRYVEHNRLLEDMIADFVTEEMKSSRLVKAMMPYLVYASRIRGNVTLISLMLRKVFMDEGIIVRKDSRSLQYRDESPRYECSVDGYVDDSYVGNEYDQSTLIYAIEYWPDVCDENFLTFLSDVEMAREFIERCFLAAGSSLEFHISDNGSPIILSDEKDFKYLGYNTNLD